MEKAYSLFFRLLRRFSSFLLYRFWAAPRMSRTDRTSLLGFHLSVPQGVFHPSLFFSSRILGEYLLSRDLRGKRVLDMGTGSGILAFCAARAGGIVTGLDVSQIAIESALSNADQNMMLKDVTFLQSNLFEAVRHAERFDVIAWNPPFYDRAASRLEQEAWNAGPGFETIRLFASSAGRFLAPGGEILMILSSDVDRERFFEGFGGFTRTPVLTSHRFFEKLTVYRLTARA